MVNKASYKAVDIRHTHPLGPVSHVFGLSREELDQVPQISRKIANKLAENESLTRIEEDIVNAVILALRQAKIRKATNGRL